MPYLLWPLLCLGVCFPLKTFLQPRHEKLSLLFKTLGTLCAVGLALSFRLPQGGQWWCVAALLLCAAADAQLGIHFITGMAAFALGHVCYILWFVSLRTPGLWSLLPFAVLLAFAAGVIFRFRHQAGKLLLPFCAYGTILCAMAALAIPCGPWTASAALLFIISDAMVCRVVLTPVSRRFDLTAMGIYYIAQLLFGAACTLV